MSELLEFIKQNPILSTILALISLIFVLAGFCIYYLGENKKRKAKEKAYGEFYDICSQFKNKGFIVSAYEPIDERDNFWLLRILREESVIEELKFSTPKSGCNAENIRKLNNVLVKLLYRQLRFAKQRV
jgi:hypothetical protein